MHPHNSVNVTGGTQIQRQLAYDLVEHCVDQMLPRHRTLWIEVELKKIPDKDKVVGYCQDDGDNMFTIEIDKTQEEPGNTFENVEYKGLDANGNR